MEIKFGAKIRELRQLKGLRQQDLAEACKVAQATIVRWEKDIDRPSGQAMILFGRLANESDRSFWWKHAGLGQADIEQIIASQPAEVHQKWNTVTFVPLLKDAAAAGTPRAIDEREIEAELAIPKQWLSRASNVTAIKVDGDSMSPILEPGYIALVDTSQRDPRRLLNQMVAARADDGVTIKWLRKDAKSTEELYILVPNHTSLRHPLRIVTPGSDSVSIVGKVVKWIGEPPPPRK